MQIPLACTLSEAELQLRRESVLDSMRRSTCSVQKLEEGYAYEFPCHSEVLQQIAQVVDMERQCCPFLTFKIVVEAGATTMRLEVTGPPAANKIIADFFGGAAMQRPRKVHRLK